MENSPLKTGQRIHGFAVTDLTPLPHLNLVLVQLRHLRTGARMIHIDCEDDNNLFAVGFRTPPADSTGIAHILEHTALCGSRRFPVRDPFFSMLKRSLNTFMNAMTAGDWTLYPFSSQNRKDFDNLLGIYLDAAFFPLLNERDFSQEGHRLEFAAPADPGSDLLYKGVVYNEMKGAMSDPASLISRRMGRALYPTTTYRHNSGGEPAEIPRLSWEQLREFHARFYHPSNAYFFSYGSFPLEEHLKTIEEQVTGHFEPRSVDSEVPPEQRLDRPRRVIETFPLDPGLPTAGKTMVQVGWLTCEITETFDRLSLSLLASLLLGNPAAPLYKALLDSKLGSNLSPGIGFHDDYRTTFFAAGLQGTEPEHAERIEQLILETLEQVARDGFTRERIEGAIHRMEFSNKEVTGDSYPYPLVLLMRVMGPWIHGGDPVAALQLDENLARLRRELDRGPFFQELIRRYLLDNPHRATLTLKPDPEQGPREEQATASELERIKASLSPEQTRKIVERAAELQQAQEAEEDLSCLPTLELEDIASEEPPVTGTTTRQGSVDTWWFEQPTNGIGYFSAQLDLEGLAEEQLPYLPMFCTLLTQVGAAGFSYLEMAQRMEAATGGISFRTSVIEDPANLGQARGFVEVKAKALERNQEKMFAILADIFSAPDFSARERLRTVINQMKASLENSIPGAGHSYAARSAASGLTVGGRLREMWSGLDQVRLVKQSAALDQSGLDQLADRFAAIAGQLLCRQRISCALTGEKPALAANGQDLDGFLQGLPSISRQAEAKAPPFTPRPLRAGWSTSVPVNYVARVFPTVPFTHPDSGPLQVLSKLLRANFLHREIREKGGAYGGMASCDPEAGIFAMLSYRDPQLRRTLKVYDDAVAWAVAGRFDGEAIKEAILAVFGDLDRPLSPGGKGHREFANQRQGLTLEMRNEQRRRILAVDRATLVAVAEKYLLRGRPESSVAVVAGEEALKKANAELGPEALEVRQI
ncbi:metalloprotease [Desulfuromonas versatilis]|uniref:Metalloprotease n=1 Tax=Desulfuromonas versatilis TaxID=2802975 RepID=A0ABN6E0E9_9BACT|nr:insulinase family protein [Desulfuromonas versatilis]BCR05851.1 metalloprotease [Desulfuromonas versatilis]